MSGGGGVPTTSLLSRHKEGKGGGAPPCQAKMKGPIPGGGGGCIDTEQKCNTQMPTDIPDGP